MATVQLRPFLPWIKEWPGLHLQFNFWHKPSLCLPRKNMLTVREHLRKKGRKEQAGKLGVVFPYAALEQDAPRSHSCCCFSTIMLFLSYFNSLHTSYALQKLLLSLLCLIRGSRDVRVFVWVAILDWKPHSARFGLFSTCSPFLDISFPVPPTDQNQNKSMVTPGRVTQEKGVNRTDLKWRHWPRSPTGFQSETAELQTVGTRFVPTQSGPIGYQLSQNVSGKSQRSASQ